MSIENDYKIIIKKNKDYVLSTFLSDYKNYPTSYKEQLLNTIQNRVFDIQDADEVNSCLKNIYCDLINEKAYNPNGEIDLEIYNWIKIVNEEIIVEKSQLLTSTKSIWNKPYLLESELKNIMPVNHGVFLKNVRHTIQLLVLKKISKKYKKPSKINVYPFLKEGYEWFLKFENDFNQEKGLTVKYTMIFEFLIQKNLLIDNFEQYRKFVVENCAKNLGSTQFARKADTSGKDSTYLTKLFTSL